MSLISFIVFTLGFILTFFVPAFVYLLPGHYKKPDPLIFMPVGIFVIFMGGIGLSLTS